MTSNYDKIVVKWLSNQMIDRIDEKANTLLKQLMIRKMAIIRIQRWYRRLRFLLFFSRIRKIKRWSYIHSSIRYRYPNGIDYILALDEARQIFS